MSVAAQPLSAEDLFNMPDNGGRNELLDGELLPMSPINMRHMQVSGRIYHLLQTFLDKHPLGVAGQELGCILARDPDVVLAPDVLFIRFPRIAAGPLPEKFFDGAPDIAVEVLSPSDTWQEIETKALKYVNHGTSLAWIINPRTQTVTIYKPGPFTLLLKITDTISGESTLPGFSAPLTDFFR